MALGATIFKADLQIADMDRSYYCDHALVLARHPSETDERLMVRLLAFALNASASLAFGRGLSTENEPDLCRKDLTGLVELWVAVGLPAEKAIRKACGRAAQVVVYAYGGRGVDVWWKQVGDPLARCRNLRVIELPQIATQALARLAQRSMQLQCTIQDGQAWLTDGEASVEIVPMERTTQAKLAARGRRCCSPEPQPPRTRGLPQNMFLPWVKSGTVPRR